MSGPTSLKTAPHDFAGGIALDPHKPAARPPLSSAPLPDRLFLELGTDDQLATRIGARVLAGQRLSTGEPYIHAPTSGRVLDIESRPTIRPTGGLIPSVVLEPDGDRRCVDPQPIDETRFSPDRLVQRLRDAGVVGMGGAGFPAHRKLARAVTEGVATLVVNAAECEPWITADASLLAAQADEVLAGAAAIAQAMALSRCLIGIDSRSSDAVAALAAALARRNDPFAWQCFAVPHRYPAGSERALVHSLTGIRLAPGERPTDRGMITFNAATLYAVHCAVNLGEPCTRRVVSITGDRAREAGDLWTHIGHPVATFATSLPGPPGTTGPLGGTETGCRITAGGPIAGWPVAVDAAIGKTTIGIDFRGAVEQPELPCIRCQRCADVCPEPLLPERLLSHARAGDAQGLHRERLGACIECGACDVVCPSGIPLLGTFRRAKSALAATAAAAASATSAQARHRRHEQRESTRRQAATEARRRRRRSRHRAGS